MMQWVLSFFLGLFLCATATLAGPAEVPVLFTNSITMSGNTNVFVAGSIPQLGNWDSTRAVKLSTNGYVWGAGTWGASIGIPEGTSFEYKFVRRATSPDSAYANSANATWEPDPNRTNSTPSGPPAPYQGRAVFYYSSWSSVSILYSNTIDGQWTYKAMTDFGPGRTSGELIWRVDGLNRAGDPNNLIYVFTDNLGNWDNPPADSGGGGATTNPCSGRVCVAPAPLVAGNTATITYYPAGGPLAGAGSVCMHYGWNGWSTINPTDQPMTAVTNSWVYTLTVPANATQFDCVFNNCAGPSATWDNNNLADWHFAVTAGGAPNLNYETPLDACVVQDKQIYNYWPPTTVSTNRIHTFTTTNYAGVVGRTIRVWVPRGYTQNTTKRYPVLYMHDGNNLFNGMGAFGSWWADTNANNLIRYGKMRETIIVGVDNTGNRFCEYSPPGCTQVCAIPTGSNYVAMIANYLRPHINNTYSITAGRTLTDADNTGALGSSLGGLISAYQGWQWSDVFGKIGCFSSSFQVCMPFPAPPAAKKPIRVYLDAGTSGDGLGNTMTERDRLVSLGYVFNMDLDNAIGFGDAHNEDAWKRRSPRAFQFLFPTSDEPNTVLDGVAPMRITAFQGAGESNIVSWTSYLKRTYTVQASTNEEFSSSMNWSNLFTTSPEPRFWDYPSRGVSNEFHFLRIRQNTVPDWPN